MVKTWPALVGRAHLPVHLLGEVALGVLLAVGLAFSWQDGVPADSSVPVIGSGPSGIAFMQVSANNLSGRPIRATQLPVVKPAPPAKPLIPTSPPVQLIIPAMNVHHAVEAVGVDLYGVIDLPADAWDAGWYNGSPVPGAPGDAVIEGHAGYPGQPMLFGRLYTLRPGDRIVVVLADGSQRLFIVVSMESLPVGAVPSGLAEPYGPARLTLFTCTGSFDKNTYSYSKRLIVEARYAGLV
jgi:hypothetical protein